MQIQSENTVDNRRIAKNTVFLYFRMLLTMAVSLYTARVVLNVLGVSDYGLYNVVCGVVTLLSFINSTLSGGTQRFLTFALGEKNDERVRSTFSSAIIIHTVIGFIILVLTEIIGLYLIYNKMTIAPERLHAAFWIFQFASIGMLLGCLQVPYEASIIAHEKMDFYAYMGIFDVSVKLLIVFLLIIIHGADLLVLYGFFYLCVSVMLIVIYRHFCKKWFDECTIRNVIGKRLDRQLFKDMLIFSGWDTIGCMASVASNQGINVLLNIFFNTVVNAARAISLQIYGAIQKFVNSFLTAVNPQITKLYASGDIDNMFTLAKRSSKYSGFLVILIGLPIFIEIDYILKIWLGQVPEYTSFFTRIAIIQGLITSIYRPLVTIVHSTGRMKWPNLIAGSVLLLIVPISYVLLKLGVGVKTIYIVNVLPWIFDMGWNIFIVRRYTGAKTLEYFPQVFLKIAVITVISSFTTYLVFDNMEYGLIRLLAVVVCSAVTSLATIYCFGMDKKEKAMTRKTISEKIWKRR